MVLYSLLLGYCNFFARTFPFPGLRTQQVNSTPNEFPNPEIISDPEMTVEVFELSEGSFPLPSFPFVCPSPVSLFVFPPGVRGGDFPADLLWFGACSACLSLSPLSLSAFSSSPLLSSPPWSSRHPILWRLLLSVCRHWSCSVDQCGCSLVWLVWRLLVLGSWVVGVVGVSLSLVCAPLIPLRLLCGWFC